MTDNQTFIHGIPSGEELRIFIHDAKSPVTMRDIAKKFQLKGQARTGVRRLLRSLEKEGVIVKEKNKTYRAASALPDTAMIEITGLDGDGEMRAKPVVWSGKGNPPAIYVKHTHGGKTELAEGMQVLATLKKTNTDEYEARVLKKPKTTETEQIIGVFKPMKGGGVVYPTDKRIKYDLFIPQELVEDVEVGDLVLVEPLPSSTKYPKSKNAARIVECLGKKDDPRLISLISIHAQGIPTVFSDDVIKETDAMKEPVLEGKRVDIRDIPLVTIDGADARDFDDAVFAELDDNPKNEGGWHLIVAIADVSFYVRAGTALDNSAIERGNSTYFPDRVVPMLPERLSNDLCSLRPHVNRACLAVHMWIDKDAKLIKYKFFRGLMRSAARLTYEQVEEAHCGNPDDTTGPLMEGIINPLYKAYSLLKRAREIRGALEINLPERQAIINDKGQVTGIIPRKRMESHQLIEEFMVLANVAAASALEDKKAPCIYRVHDSPAADRLETTRDFLKGLGYSLPRTDNIHPKDLNHILKLTMDRPDKDLIHTVLLRTQSQAAYSPENIGHFGLALAKYGHFTSPIRRYADLIVHRSLVRAFGLGDGGLTDEAATKLQDTCEHISKTERRSMLAERDANDRFTAQYLSANVGQCFAGKISSVTRFGLFVMLDESGADGIVPMRSLPGDYYIHDEKNHALVGKRSGRTYRLADPVTVRLLEADPMRGSTVFELVEGSGREQRGDTQKRNHRHKRDGDKRKTKSFRKKKR